MNRSHYVYVLQNQHFVVSKDEWDTKEGTGKSMKKILYVLRCAKGTSRDKATSNSKKIKPIALAVIELCLSEGIRKLIN